MHHYVHLHGNPEDRNELHSGDFKDWEAVAFKHPDYLEDNVETGLRRIRLEFL